MLYNKIIKIAESKFTPDERKYQHGLVRKKRMDIENMNIPEGEKEMMRDAWLDYMMIYDIEYMKRQKTAIEKSLSLLN
jgi:hypothetical protein